MATRRELVVAIEEEGRTSRGWVSPHSQGACCCCNVEGWRVTLSTIWGVSTWAQSMGWASCCSGVQAHARWDAAVAVMWAARPVPVQLILTCELGAMARAQHIVPGLRRVRISPSPDCGCASMQ